MKKWFLTFLILIVFPALASHIVGGEFELVHISGNEYQLNLIYYFDETNGDQGNKKQDSIITARIFRVSDNAVIRDVQLPFVSETPVNYTQPKCSSNGIKTSRQFYSTRITLQPNIFNDPQGYYITWERCCRNYQILNIVDEAPPFNVTNPPNSAGQTFYLKFPPVVIGGSPFINSTPRLFPPLSDYGCAGRPYYANFAGTDDDGDSLVYTIVTPLDTHDHNPYPVLRPAPFPDVRWQFPFSATNIMGGHPDLAISKDGLLTVTPGYLGLYVFAVKCEEYRNKIKIGEVRRDFQMLVTDGCEPDHPPSVAGKKLGDASFTYQNTMSISFANTVTDGNRCIQVQVSDPESNLPPDSTEFVSLRMVPLNFSKTTDVSSIGISPGSAILSKGSTKDFTICFPQCPFINGPYEVGIIAFDDACSLPMSDTLRVIVDVQPPPNTPPHFTSVNPITAQIDEGDSTSWNFTIVDDEGNDMELFVLTDGFVLADAGMSVTVNKQPGLITGKIHWDAYCDIYNFTQRTSFQIKLLVNDIDQCSLDLPVPAIYNLSVRLPGVADPLIDTDPHEYQVGSLVRKIGESLSFEVKGTQADGDFLILRNDDELGGITRDISFLPDSANFSVTSHFQWDIRCADVDLAKTDEFQFRFVLIDRANKCRILKTDTATVKVKVLPPDNTMPDLVIQSLSTTQVVGDNLSITFGEPINLGVYGTDADVFPTQDSLTLQLLEATGNVPPEGYHFKDSIGVGSVQSPFTWTPDCAIFKQAVYENDYQLKFSLTDNRCFNVKGDTVTLHLKIKDVESKPEEFLPYNVITPNGDGCNDYFAVEGIDPMSEGAGGCGAIDDPDKFVSLPADNCAGSFQYVKIMNRWGKEVFQSSDRKFRWYAQNDAAGVYYYYIKFGNHEYKGALSVRP